MRYPIFAEELLKGGIFKFSTMVTSYRNNIGFFLILNLFAKVFKSFKRIIFVF